MAGSKLYVKWWGVGFRRKISAEIPVETESRDLHRYIFIERCLSRICVEIVRGETCVEAVTLGDLSGDISMRRSVSC